MKGVGWWATTVVVAEDDADLRRLYAESLRGAGYVVWEAGDGAEALSLVRAHAPDLLLLDIWMPVLNGIEVLEQLDGAPEAMRLKIVVLSQIHDADTQLEGFALGVDEYWTKDLSLADLPERIGRLMRAARTTPVQPG